MKMNANRLSQKQLMGAQSMMGAMGMLQKIGKGRRKCKVYLQKTSKKFLATIAKEMKKQFAEVEVNPQMAGVVEFLGYLEIEAKKKPEHPIMLSFEELEFLKRTLVDNLAAIDAQQYKWWQFLKKSVAMTQGKNVKNILTDLNK